MLLRPRDRLIPKIKQRLKQGNCYFYELSGLEVWVDLGYQGIQSDYEGEMIEIPYKKPRKSQTNPNLQDAVTANRLIEDLNLGIGEAEALALAIEQQADIVATDDRNGIRACKLLRLRFTTAIGILIRLRERGRLTANDARRGLERLAVYGRYRRTTLEDAKRRLEGGQV